MRLFGLEITRAKAVTPTAPRWIGRDTAWLPVVSIREPFTGAWQRNLEERFDTTLSNPTVFRCSTLIASDIAKCGLRLVALDSDGIWQLASSAAFSPVLRKPNRYQNRIQFINSWLLSKLNFGNTYVLKERDDRNVVVALYVLDPNRVKPLVAPDGAVYYQLTPDNLSGLQVDVTVPASEIIHDRWNTVFHPLVGVSPIYACGLPAWQGQAIQRGQTAFFQNGSNPGGVLTAPGTIDDITAQRLKTTWEERFGNGNQGKVAVLGDGLKYEAMAFNAVDSQLIEQLKWTDEKVCSCFGVPAYMVGVGAAPLNNNVEALTQQYYGQCLQILIESLELCLDEGLGFDAKKDGVQYGTEFDLDDLLRMDSATLVKTLSEGVLGGIYKPNEARKRLNYAPVTGGDQVFLQQQNFSLEALAKRDAQEDPFGTSAAPAPTPANDTQAAAEQGRAVASFRRTLAHARR